jgi:hypothetical protein
MRKIILLLVSSFFIICTSCSSESDFEENGNNTILRSEVQKIAKEYGYHFENSNSNNTFNLLNTVELKNTLDSIKVNFEKPKFESINSDYQNDEVNINKLIDSTYNLITKTNRTKGGSEKMKTAGDPSLTRSLTVYFNNTFPCSNVYVTVNYSVNSSGNITNAQIVSGSYGYSLGNTYSQTNVVLQYQNGTLVFQVNGQFSTSVGVGSFSLSNSNNVTYTGYMQLPYDAGGGAPSFKLSMYVKQQPK